MSLCRPATKWCLNNGSPCPAKAYRLFIPWGVTGVDDSARVQMACLSRCSNSQTVAISGVANVYVTAPTNARALNHPAKKSTTPVSKLYIAPAILIAPFDSISASTGLSLRMSAIVISTFLRATASTNA
jgi:hypothetical protein